MKTKPETHISVARHTRELVLTRRGMSPTKITINFYQDEGDDTGAVSVQLSREGHFMDCWMDSRALGEIGRLISEMLMEIHR